MSAAGPNSKSNSNLNDRSEFQPPLPASITHFGSNTRTGCFEIQAAVIRNGQLSVSPIHSKLATRRWPKAKVET